MTSHVPIPAKERQRRFRDRRRRGVFVVPVEVTGEIVEALVDQGALDEAGARDLDSVGEAIAAAARRGLRLDLAECPQLGAERKSISGG